MAYQSSNKFGYNRIISNAENDYNPFNILSFNLDNPSQFNGGIAFAGCPPFNNYTKAEFANLPIEIMAAYADGVVRGSYEKKWIIDQLESFDPHMDTNDCAIGALAYIYLKTKNSSILGKLSEWKKINNNNHNTFF